MALEVPGAVLLAEVEAAQKFRVDGTSRNNRKLPNAIQDALHLALLVDSLWVFHLRPHVPVS